MYSLSEFSIIWCQKNDIFKKKGRFSCDYLLHWRTQVVLYSRNHRSNHGEFYKKLNYSSPRSRSSPDSLTNFELYQNEPIHFWYCSRNSTNKSSMRNLFYSLQSYKKFYLSISSHFLLLCAWPLQCSSWFWRRHLECNWLFKSYTSKHRISIIFESSQNINRSQWRRFSKVSTSFCLWQSLGHTELQCWRRQVIRCLTYFITARGIWSLFLKVDTWIHCRGKLRCSVGYTQGISIDYHYCHLKCIYIYQLLSLLLSCFPDIIIGRTWINIPQWCSDPSSCARASHHRSQSCGWKSS